MAVGKVVLKVRARGADRLLRNFNAAADALPDDTLAAQRELGRRAEIVFSAHAPHRTGRLIRGIASIVLGDKVIVKDEARNPASGYDYVGVTRFGHKAARIYPKHTPAVSLANGKSRRGALRFVIGGRVVYAASVAGYHPASDWADDAMPEVQAEAQSVASRLGARVEARF